MFHNKNPKSFVFNFWGSLHFSGGSLFYHRSGVAVFCARYLR